MNFFKQTIAAAAIATGLCVPAFADTTLNVHYPMPGFFISKKFMEDPDIRINFINPSAAYKEEIQTILRQAGTSEMPDITFIGLNRLRLIAECGVNVDMKPHIAKEKDVAGQGFSILHLAQVGDQQVGLAFATSNPIMYHNADFGRAAGSNPKTWDEIIALGAKIMGLGDGNEGINFRWQGDDWIFSALLFGNGGAMLSPDEKKVAFNSPEGLAAINLIGRMVKEGGMPVLTKQAVEQAFVADKVGISLLRDDC